MAYHGSNLISSLRKISAETNVHISRYTFSEAQSGKSACDRMASVIKRKLHDFTDQGNSVTNADEFLSALEASNQMRGIFAYSATTNIPDNQQNKLSIKDISIFTDFNFPKNSEHIQAYRYYSFGEGVRLEDSRWKQQREMALLTLHQHVHSPLDLQWPTTTCSLTLKDTDARTAQECSEPVAATDGGNSNEQEENDNEINVEHNGIGVKEIFDCPVQGCTAKFTTWGRMNNHVLRGLHFMKPERITMKDFALQMYSARIENIQSDRLIQPLQDVIHEIETNKEAVYEKKPLEKGWALPPKKQRGLWTENVKRFLDEKFLEGERTKQKYDPKTVAKMMEDSQRFTIRELKNYREIASYFSRKTARLRNVAGCIQNPRNRDCPVDGAPDPMEEGEGEGELDFETDPLFPAEEDVLFSAVQEKDGPEHWSEQQNNT